MAQEIADSTLLDTWGSGGNIVKPDVSKIIEGWQLGEQPPHEYMNWLQNTFGSKLNHILKNGVANWNNETEYLAGSSAQHNGNVWLCKTTNTNSEPADANANWKRIITVESLTTVLGGYVATTGNQTIAGVKTFSSSPIVPTPTTDTQAANKAYVDSVAVTPDASTTVKGIVELATNEETATGTDATRAITPAGLMSAFNKTGTAPMFACRSWVNFNGTGTIAIRASGNVSSITDNGVGDYTVNFSTAMTDDKYAGNAFGGDTSSTGQVGCFLGFNSVQTISSFRFRTGYFGANTFQDFLQVHVSIFR